MSDADLPADLASSSTPIRERRGSRVKRWLVICPLAVLVTVGGAAGWYAYEYYSVINPEGCRGILGKSHQALNDKEEAARDALDKAGALVITDPVSKRVTSLDMMGKHASEENLKQIACLYGLVNLNLTSVDLRDADLAHFTSLPELASLVLNLTPIGDDGLVHVANMTGLDALHLGNTKVTSKGLPTLGRMKQLKVLDLRDTKVTDDGLEHLAGLDHVEWLLLGNTPVTDAGIAKLEGMESLKRLTLTGTKVSEQAVAKIRKAIPGLVVDLQISPL
jgi:hypothetical protein